MKPIYLIFYLQPEMRELRPETPWELMIGFRNRLIHEYFRVNLHTVWDTLKEDLPNLIPQTEPIIPPEDEI